MNTRLVKSVDGKFYEAEYDSTIKPSDPNAYFSINGHLRVTREIDNNLEAEVYAGLGLFTFPANADPTYVSEVHRDLLGKVQTIVDRNTNPFYIIIENISKRKVPKLGWMAYFARAIGGKFGLGFNIEYAVNAQLRLFREIDS